MKFLQITFRNYFHTFQYLIIPADFLSSNPLCLLFINKSALHRRALFVVYKQFSPIRGNKLDLLTKRKIFSHLENLAIKIMTRNNLNLQIKEDTHIVEICMFQNINT